jgi:GT2 family glycosyltransferase
VNAPRYPITVGISTVDRPAALARCIEALLAGTLLPDEILVIDQGQAGADAVVADRANGSLPLTHVRQPRRGLSVARNAMFEQARNPVVAVTDDDCVPDAAWIASIADALHRSPVPDAVCGRVLALPQDGNRTHAVSLRVDTVPADFTSEAIPWRVGTGANFAARREAVLGVGGYDERLGAGSAGHAAEDVDLALRLLRRGSRIRYEPAVVVYHERQPEERRLATRWSYAHGIGAVAGMLGRRRDRFAATMLAAFGRDVVARLVRAVRSRDRSGVRQAFLSVGGAVDGIAYGWRVAPMPRRLERSVESLDLTEGEVVTR